MEQPDKGGISIDTIVIQINDLVSMLRRELIARGNIIAELQSRKETENGSIERPIEPTSPG